MIINLYDSNERSQKGRLKLPPRELFQERLNYLEDNFFSVDEYQKFYCKQTTDSKDRDYVKYWFGVKPVGHMQKNENVKHTLDHFSSYLLNSKDFDTSKNKKRYLELLEKCDIGRANEEEISELDTLRNMVLYRKPTGSYKYSKNLIFMVNDKYEDFVKHKRKDVYDKLIKIRHDLNCSKAFLSNLRVGQQSLTKEISKIYSSLKSNNVKKEEAVLIVNNLIKNINKVKNEVSYTRRKIEGLCSDYLFITEGIIHK